MKAIRLIADSTVRNLGLEEDTKFRSFLYMHGALEYKHEYDLIASPRHARFPKNPGIYKAVVLNPTTKLHDNATMFLWPRLTSLNGLTGLVVLTSDRKSLNYAKSLYNRRSIHF